MVPKVPLVLVICDSPAHESRRLSDVRVGGGHSTTGGVPDSGGGLGRAASSGEDGESGCWQEDPPTSRKAVTHPAEGGKEGGTSGGAWDSTRGLSVTVEAPGPQPFMHKRLAAYSDNPQSLNSRLPP